MTKAEDTVLTANPITVFIQYALPATFAMIAMSSAMVIDGIFVGNYIGSNALAAVNITIPAFSLVAGLCIMLASGTAVRCGKYLGEKNSFAASEMFSKSSIAIAAIAILFAISGMAFSLPVSRLLGAEKVLIDYVNEYIFYFFLFVPSIAGCVYLAGLAQVDGQPILSAIAMLLSACLNIFFDWLFIAHLQIGIKGAAIATGLSMSVSFLLLLIFFFSAKSKLKFKLPTTSWLEVFKAAYNGISEMVSELSIGLTTLLFNNIIMHFAGANGVAAFSVINFIIMFELTIIFGMSDATRPLISKNFGARQPARILHFFNIATSCIAVVSLLAIGLLIAIPEIIGSFFLKEEDTATLTLVLEFSKYFWPAFLFNGMNVLIAAYLTALHKATASLIVALLRSLIFPVAVVLTLSYLFGMKGFFATIPVAEALSLCVSAYLFIYHRPKRVVTTEVA